MVSEHCVAELDDALVFGIAVRQMPAPAVFAAANEAKSPAHLAAEYAQRRARLLRALLPAAESTTTLELRVIVTPNGTQPSSGRVRIAVLHRVDRTVVGAATIHAATVRQQLLGTFPETDWDVLNALDVQQILDPFAVADLLRIARRAHRIGEGVPDHEHRRIRGFGIDAEDGMVAGRLSEGVDYIAPFVPSQGGLDQFCRLLLLGDHPTALSVRICRLLPDARDFDVHDKSLAELHALVGHTAANVTAGSSQPLNLLRRVSLAVEPHMVARHPAVGHAAFFARLELASSGPISASTVASAAELFTRPPASPMSDATQVYGDVGLDGGYVAARPRRMERAIGAFRTVALKVGRTSEARRHHFTLAEAESLVFIPGAPSESFPGIAVRGWRRIPAPPNVGVVGVPLGVTMDTGVERPVALPWPDRLRHVYAIGQTGCGKSTLLLQHLLADIEAGHGVGLLDPHGDLINDVLARIPAHRERDVVIVDPTDIDFPVSLNPLIGNVGASRHSTAEAMVDIVRRLTTDEHGAAARDWMGPMFTSHVRMAMLLLMSHPNRPASLFDFHRFFEIPDYYQRWLPAPLDDPELLAWVEGTLKSTNYQRGGGGTISIGDYIKTKFDRFVFQPALRLLFCQRHTTVNLRDVLAQRRILLVNLAKGQLGEGNSRFAGMVVLSMLLTAVLERGSIPQADRHPFFLYLDEFQNTATSALNDMLSEGRKFGLGLTLAHQFLAQVREAGLADAVLGNAGTQIVFRAGASDAERLQHRFHPSFAACDLTLLPNYHACVSTISETGHVAPFTVRTRPANLPGDPETAARIREMSRQLFGVPRAVAERDVLNEMGEGQPS